MSIADNNITVFVGDTERAIKATWKLKAYKAVSQWCPFYIEVPLY